MPASTPASPLVPWPCLDYIAGREYPTHTLALPSPQRKESRVHLPSPTPSPEFRHHHLIDPTEKHNLYKYHPLGY